MLPKALKMDRWFQIISVYYRYGGACKSLVSILTTIQHGKGVILLQVWVSYHQNFVLGV
jgi:Fe-S cluster biogenesis protein NfuA